MRAIYISLLFLSLISTIVSNGQNFILLKDINSGSGSSNPKYLTKINNTVCFRADNQSSGYDLWKTDGSSEGTVLIKSFPGSQVFENLDATSLRDLTDVNGTLFFVGDDGQNGVGPELWKSNGTSTGTVLVKDIVPGDDGSGNNFTSHIAYLTTVNGTLFFRAIEHTYGTELWKSDGTNEGTVIVKDIYPGATFNGDPQNLTAVGSILYFTAQNGNGIELWRSDGTEAGTAMVKDINPSGSSNPINLTNVNGTLFFYANDGTHGYELWKSDGSQSGTQMVKDINAGCGSSYTPSASYGLYLVNLNGILFFNADNGLGVQGDGVTTRSNYELWRSDGTPGGTYMVKNISYNPGGIGDYSSDPEYLTNVNGVLFFRAHEYFSGVELYRSDGTSDGTYLVKDIVTSSTEGSYPLKLTAYGNLVLFTASDQKNSYSVYGRELWQSDGTSEGTRIVQDIWPGTNSAFPEPDPNNPLPIPPYEIVDPAGTLFFTANNGTNGAELWVSNNAVLPVRFIDFTVQNSSDGALLKWTTAQEINVSAFIVEKSLNGENYLDIGSLPAANSNGDYEYRFTDAATTSPDASKIYYRILEKDVDGRITYSKVVILLLKNPRPSFLLYPNPVDDKASLIITANRNENIQWQIVDNAGRMVRQSQTYVSSATSSVVLNLNELAKGIYYMHLIGNSFNQQLKFIKK